MSVRLFSDSACDLTQQEAKEKGVTVLPLKTLIDGVVYLDGVTITSAEFYEKLRTCKDLPTTSQLTPVEFTDAIAPVLEAGDEAVILCLSGKLSGTVQSARIAAQDAGKSVWVVDSGNVTLAQRILLDYAIRLRDQGLGAEALAAELERVKSRICLIARVDTLEYLMRGGRLSRTAAVAGTVLHIKPILSVDDGEITVIGKARGTRHSDSLVTEAIQKKGGIDFSMPVCLGFSGTDDRLLKEYLVSCPQLWEGHLAQIPVTMIGSTISTHAGPGAIAVAFFAKE